MTKEEFITWFNHSLPPESRYRKIDITLLLKFEKSNFNRNSDNLPLVTNGEYHNWPNYRGAVSNFVTGEKKLLLSNTIPYKFCYQSNRVIISEKIIKNTYTVALTCKEKKYKTKSSKVILEEEQIDDNTIKCICKTSQRITYFTIQELLSDFLNLRLSPPDDYDHWKDEKQLIIKFIEKYGLQIIPYDFIKPVSERLNFFYCVKYYYSEFDKFYRRKMNRHKSLSPQEKSILPKNDFKKLKTLSKLFPKNPVKKAFEEMIGSFSLNKIENYLGYSKKRKAIIPVSEVTNSILALLYLHLWHGETKNYDFIRCRRCKNYFLRDIPQRQYCTAACAHAAAQQRYRRKSH